MLTHFGTSLISAKRFEQSIGRNLHDLRLPPPPIVDGSVAVNGDYEFKNTVEYFAPGHWVMIVWEGRPRRAVAWQAVTIVDEDGEAERANGAAVFHVQSVIYTGVDSARHAVKR